MTRRRRVMRWTTRALATVAIGGFIGFLVPTIARDLSPVPEEQRVVAESPAAREFINAFTADDQGELTRLGIPAEVKLRASRFRADYTSIAVPVHLGSYVAGGFSLHSYAAHAIKKDGSESLLSWRVISAGGQVGLILPPNPIEPS